MKISLIIPAYDEEKNIKRALERYSKFFKLKFKEDYEIIVVANNCKDNTFEIVKNFAKINKSTKKIKAINFPGYIGKGKAVMEGFKLAKGDYIGFVDTDESTSPENFFKLYKNKNNFDGIIASRRKKGALIIPRRRLSKSLPSYIFNKFVNFLFDLKFKDTQCGAKIFKKNTAKFLTKNYTQTGWNFDVDLLYLCKKNNLKILEVPIIWRELENSKLTIMAGIISALKIFKYRLKKF